MIRVPAPVRSGSYRNSFRHLAMAGRRSRACTFRGCLGARSTCPSEGVQFRPRWMNSPHSGEPNIVQSILDIWLFLRVRTSTSDDVTFNRDLITYVTKLREIFLLLVTMLRLLPTLWSTKLWNLESVLIRVWILLKLSMNIDDWKYNWKYIEMLVVQRGH